MKRRVLVTGATGYIGGRLVPALLDGGLPVRALARSPERLRDMPWADQIEIVRGDASVPADLDRAMADVDVAYYLLHSLVEGEGFEDTESAMATTFGDAARRADVRRIVYLGGLVPAGSRPAASRRTCARG